MTSLNIFRLETHSLEVSPGGVSAQDFLTWGKSSFEAKRETKNDLILSQQQQKRPYRNDKDFHLNLNFTNQIIVTQHRDEDIIIIILATLSGDD